MREALKSEGPEDARSNGYLLREGGTRRHAAMAIDPRNRRFACAVLPWFSTERILRLSPPQLAKHKPAAPGEGGGRAITPRTPFALVTLRRGRREVVAASERASRYGVRAGMTAVACTAILQDLVLLDHDEEGDTLEWARLTRICQGLSPLVGRLPAVADRDPADPHAAPTLWIETTGCDRLHGGEPQLLARWHSLLREQGYPGSQFAIADTVGAARALALTVPARARIDARPWEIGRTGASGEALANRPVKTLAIAQETLDALDDLALDTIGEFLSIGRRRILARFGEAVAATVDEALGLRPTPLIAEPFDEPLSVRLPLEGATDQQEAVVAVLTRLVGEVAAWLASEGTAARTLQVVLIRAPLYREVATPVVIDVPLSVPQRGTRALLDLLRPRVEAVDLSEPIEEISVRVMERVPVAASHPGGLFTDESRTAGARPETRAAVLGAMLDLLRERLGHDAVGRLWVEESHVPEAASVRRPLTPASRTGDLSGLPGVGAYPPPRRPRAGTPSRPRPHPTSAAARVGDLGRPPRADEIRAVTRNPRPLALLDPPPTIHLRTIPAATTPDEVDAPPTATFRHAGRTFTIVSRAGPERIESDWWLPSGQLIARDYILAATATGELCWIFRDRTTDRWHLHAFWE